MVIFLYHHCITLSYALCSQNVWISSIIQFCTCSFNARRRRAQNSFRTILQVTKWKVCVLLDRLRDPEFYSFALCTTTSRFLFLGLTIKQPQFSYKHVASARQCTSSIRRFFLKFEEIQRTFSFHAPRMPKPPFGEKEYIYIYKLMSAQQFFESHDMTWSS